MLKNHSLFDTDDENAINLPRQTSRFLSIDASLATILPPKINKVWLFVAQKVDKSFTPEQRKSENTFTKYLKRCNFYQISNNFKNLSTTNFQSKAASAHCPMLT